MADANVTLLLSTGLRVDELDSLTWDRVRLQPRSGWIDVVGTTSSGEPSARVP
jgi:site-specific recombinase XerC